VVISIACAFLVGFTLTGGLGTILPVMRVLIHGDTIQGWAYRSLTEQRLGIRFSQETQDLQLIEVSASGPSAGKLKIGDVIEQADPPAGIPPSPFPANDPKYRAGEILRQVAWSPAGLVHLTASGRPIEIIPKTPVWYRFARIGLRFAERMPIKPVPAVAEAFGIMAVIAVFGQGMRFIQEYLSDKVGIHAVNDMRRQLYDRMLRAPLQYFGQRGTSDITSRLVSDAATLQDGFKQVLGQSIQEPIKVAMALGCALLLSWRLTLLIILFAPIMLIIVRKFGKKMRRASRAALQSSSEMLGQLESTLQGIRVVKGNSAESFERRRYVQIMAKLMREQLRMSRTDAFSAPVLELAIMLMAGCVVLVATKLIVAGSLNPDNFLAIMLFLFIIADSLRRISKVSNALQKSNAAAARIFEVLALPVEREHRPARINGEPAPMIMRKLQPLQSTIAFENITFRYPNTQSPAVDGVTLIVPKGQSVAIVGRNGSGKTTLLALLERFYDPQSGRVAIDGNDIRGVALSSLRRQISIVTQESVIFPGTIAQNIAYANPLAAPDFPDSPSRRELFKEIEDAAKRAFAHEFITDKPQGYDTKLGELGGQLSGGQRQRLCIARAILRKAPILILDEATSQVDAESEHLIQQATEQLMHQRTTFVIAHRFSTIISADKIVVMERGKIVGQGKHEELLKDCETYQKLYERQLGGGEGMGD
jgi:subfamily B ATP-binding cassette protein MsbA